jgi:hypothetical protein
MMADIKNYMNGLINEILEEMDMSPEERERHAQTLAYSLESLSNEEYMMTITSAFSGKGDMGAVEDFINTTFELPDLREVNQQIFDNVTAYLRKNLPAIDRPDPADPARLVQLFTEAQVDQIIEIVQNELRADRGPDLYLLGPLMEENGLNAAERG